MNATSFSTMACLSSLTSITPNHTNVIVTIGRSALGIHNRRQMLSIATSSSGCARILTSGCLVRFNFCNENEFFNNCSPDLLGHVLYLWGQIPVKYAKSAEMLALQAPRGTPKDIALREAEVVMKWLRGYHDDFWKKFDRRELMSQCIQDSPLPVESDEDESSDWCAALLLLLCILYHVPLEHPLLILNHRPWMSTIRCERALNPWV